MESEHGGRGTGKGSGKRQKGKGVGNRREENIRIIYSMEKNG